MLADVFQDGDPMAIEAAEWALALIDTLKREDQSQIKYDSRFSEWKVLIGPDDWDNYSVGKGEHRYRVHNLPGRSSSGVYEIAVYPAGSSSRANPGKLDPDKVVVVYVGKADNIRTRLQQHGRTGAHLGRSCHGEKGFGCLQDIFARGDSIVYRWIPTKNNVDAQRKETQLLKTYDYAWNKGSNGARRHDDILKKLEKCASNYTTLAIFSRKHVPLLQKQVGIKINARNLLSQDNFFGQVFKVNRSQPRLLLDHSGFNEKDNTITCGVHLGDGSICRRPPTEGRKRCAEHKGKKTKGSSSRLNTSEKSQPHKPCSEYRVLDNGKLNVHGEKIPIFDLVPSLAGKCPETELRSPICGVAMGDGSLCRSQPVSGRKRCDLHKGRTICSSNSETRRYRTVPHSVFNSDPNETSSFDKGSSGIFISGKVETGVASQRPVSIKGCDTICGVELGAGYFCTKQPVRGRIRCEDHKGMSVTSLLSASDAKSKPNVLDTDSRSNSCNRNYGSSSSSKSICGATTSNGSFCQRTVDGNGRCWQHLNNGNSSAQYLNYGSSSSSSVCGAPTQDGSSCQRTVKENGRCWQHSNYGNSSAQYLNYGSSSSSVCGAPTQDGSSCQRTVKENGRCWQHSNYGSCSSSSSCSRSSIFSPQYSNYGCYSASICGAPTRNGSYCRRTVRGGGRCWQH